MGQNTQKGIALNQSSQVLMKVYLVVHQK